jgi:ApaG protein
MSEPFNIPLRALHATSGEQADSMSEVITRGIRVIAEARFHPEKSSRAEQYFFFSYQITIRNESDETVQLMSRHWTIHDANGNQEEVIGPGVVGEQPVIAPGEEFTYSSFCPLRTEVGSMRGTYQMVTANGETFDAAIAPFTLARPQAIH